MYNEYSNTIGDIIVGEIYQIRRNEILINHNRNELILPKRRADLQGAGTRRATPSAPP